jgi:SAM-dependent methyltransferase
MYHWVKQKCPICEIPPSKYLGRRGGPAHRQRLGVECEVWRCGECGLIFPNPMPIPIGGLEQHYAVDPQEYFIAHDLEQKKSNAAKMLDKAESLVKGKGSLLDIGCGRGELLRVAKDKGWDAKGLELSSTFADYAQNHSQAEIYRKPVEECGFKKESFHVVILAAVLEHLYNPDEVVKEIARILKPGGALYIDVPNETGLYFRIGNMYHRLKGRNWVVNLAPTFSPYHVFGFNHKSLKALLSKHRLTPREWNIYGGTSCVPSQGGITSFLEQQASKFVTSISSIGKLGTYMEVWAIKM